MSVLYLECNMGAAGDMLLAALTELLPDPEGFVARLNGLNIPGVHFHRERVNRCGIAATHLAVHVDGVEEVSEDVLHDHYHEHEQEHTHAHGHDHEHDHAHHHHHAGLAGIRSIISALEIPEPVKSSARAVYDLLADAEARAHNTTVELIHFHEVGTMDAVADIVGVCLAMYELNPTEIICSPIRTGFGQVRCAHGILPVPAPATAALLEGVPVYGGDIEGELCTPTGAALIKHFVHRFGAMPTMCISKTGYGAGKKEFPAANVVRACLGETASGFDGPNEAVVCLSCNLDDMTGEDLGYAAETLRQSGAREVYIVPIQMKKNRPGQMLCCICLESEADRFAHLMLKHTTTLGVRRQSFGRYALNRSVETSETELGPVRFKVASGYGVERRKPEAEDLIRIAGETGLSLEEVRANLLFDE